MSFTLAEFEEIVGSQINYTLSKEGNLYGRVPINGKNIIISLSNDAKAQLVKNKIITDETLVASVKPVKTSVPVNSKPGLYVVLTAKNGKVPFWMMTYYDPTVTDIELSEVSGAELINIWEKNGIDAAIEAYENGILLNERNVPQKSKSGKKNAKPKDKTSKATEESTFWGDFDVIDAADIAAIEAEIKAGNFTESELNFLWDDKSDDSGTDELDSIIDEGTFDDL